MDAIKFSPLPVTCYTTTPICVVQPETPNVCTPLPPCAKAVPTHSDITLALMVLAVLLIAAGAIRRKP